MKYWSMTLHFYQPPTQDLNVTHDILKFCYLPLLKTLDQKPNIGLTLNLAGSLLEQLQSLNEWEFFDLVKKLVGDGKIEIINSVMYHPIIPLTNPDSVRRQITKNTEILQKLLNTDQIKGFFPPELAVNQDSLNRLNFDYVLVNQSATNTTGVAKYQKKFLLNNNYQICHLLRSYPELLRVDNVLRQAHSATSDYLITANDAELFGHHYAERLDVLSGLLDDKSFKFVTASQLLDKFSLQAREVDQIYESTWQDCQGFDLWNKNFLQQHYIHLLKKVCEIADESVTFDQATSSCYLYWLSNWPWWHPGLVEKGVNKLLPLMDGHQEIRVIYDSFMKAMWDYHMSGEVEKNYRKFDEAKKTK